MLSDMPKDSAKEFLDVFKSITDEAEKARAVILSPKIEESIASIARRTKETLRGSLVSVGHIVDDARGSLKEMKRDLEIAQSDNTNSSHVKVLPSPFVKRYVERIERTAEHLRQNLLAYGNDPGASDDDAKVVGSMLEKQHLAVLRCAERVARIRSKLEQARVELDRRFKMSLAVNEADQELTERTVVEEIKATYKAYKSENKAKTKKMRDESDLFGNDPKVSASAAKSGFGSWSGGTGFGTGFGSGNQSRYQTNTRQQKGK